ncbi:hypothetical protein VTI74DRAFT_4202 [Chaetomium olivicolor]
MFPSTRGPRYPRSESLAGHPSPAPQTLSFSHSHDIVHIPSSSRNSALSRIEDLLGSIVDAIASGDELIIPYQTIRSSQNAAETASAQRDGRAVDIVKFPGRTIQEAKKFEALFRIIELSHEALLSGSLITKRNIYYQNPDLFRSQGVVDDMVDNLAFTLGIGREDLNIVAAAKGLISGPMDLMLRDGSIHSCDISGTTGMLLPSVTSIEKINFRNTRWLLVIEKEAKGFPDLATRRFLSMLHAARPELCFVVLVDFDPHGVAIMRTYKYGSRRLDHEENATAPRLRWLGIRSDDIVLNTSAGRDETYDLSQSQMNQEATSQVSMAYSFDDSQTERPAKRAKRDRKKAVEVLRDISASKAINRDGLDEMQELQRMLMLNVKAEIQAVDNYGNIANWLDRKLSI